MSRRVVCLTEGKEERFLLWSSVVDAPVTKGMSEVAMREELSKSETAKDVDWLIRAARENGVAPMLEGEKRLTRAERILCGNRAGPREARATSLRFLWRLYCEVDE